MKVFDMSKNVYAVIGAGYGDEGKGLFTDYLCNEINADIVVRANSGAQAGHTVTLSNGRRHVFSHFGSGSFLNVPTFLSRFFVSNPILFLFELENLFHLDLKPIVFVDERSFVTTPYEMRINQLIETARGEGRHGSCGIGFGETIEREEKGFHLSVKDLFLSKEELRYKLMDIRDLWIPQRLKALNLNLNLDEMKMFESSDVVDNFIEDCKDFISYVKVTSEDFKPSWNNIVFENAQGLKLDQFSEDFPFVTRSNTGLKNISLIMNDWNLDEIKVVYAHRCYTTRHGAGPLLNELNQIPVIDFEDKTNVPNDWQGSLRFAYLNLDELKMSIKKDLNSFKTSIKVDYVLGISCLDQIKGNVYIKSLDKEYNVLDENVASFIEKNTGIQVWLRSWGPTRNTILKDD